jgi:hypothetical protein
LTLIHRGEFCLLLTMKSPKFSLISVTNVYPPAYLKVMPIYQIKVVLIYEKKPRKSQSLATDQTAMNQSWHLVLQFL